MDKELQKWRKEGRHLPGILRDFHDQKDVFKALHDMTALHEIDHLKVVNPIVGHCYIIDCFLWFMARHGYTLQRSRAKINFESLKDNMRICGAHRDDIFSRALGMPPKDGSPDNQAQEAFMAIKEKTRITADPGHVAVRMMVVKMEAGIMLPPTEADEKREALFAGMDKWCSEHDIDLVWTTTAGRKEKGRIYRVGYNGTGTQDDLTNLLDAFDAEIARLMAL